MGGEDRRTDSGICIADGEGMTEFEAFTLLVGLFIGFILGWAIPCPICRLRKKLAREIDKSRK